MKETVCVLMEIESANCVWYQPAVIDTYGDLYRLSEDGILGIGGISYRNVDNALKVALDYKNSKKEDSAQINE